MDILNPYFGLYPCHSFLLMLPHFCSENKNKEKLLKCLNPKVVIIVKWEHYTQLVKSIERGSHVYCHISYDHDRLYQEYLKQKSD